MLDNGFSCDFLALCDAGWVVRQTRNWVRFSDNGDLRDYLQTMNRTALDSAWLRREGRGGPWRLFREWQSGESYWDVARSLIPREIGGNNYIDSRGDANFALPELPPQNTSNLVLSGTLFRDTLKAVCVYGQDAPDSHLVSTNFNRSCTDDVGIGISEVGAGGMPMRHI